MRVTKFIALIAAVALLSACEKQKITMDDPSAEMNGVSTQIVDMDQSFILINKSNKLPGNLAKNVADAKGELVRTIPEVGLAVVTSADPGFKAKAGKIKGVDAIVPNLKSQYIDPGVKYETVSAEYGNPPFSGDDDFHFDLQWGHDAVDAPEAWELGYRGNGVRVGILDTGFDLDQPDLAANINLALSANMTAEGGPEPWYLLPDAGSHGTHTAGTVGAVDNGFGVIGVAPEVELVLIKVLWDEGSGYLSDILNGIMYASAVECDVINMSIGATIKKNGDPEEGYTAADAAWYKNIYSKVIAHAYQNGTAVITSAGNEGVDYDHAGALLHMPSGAPHAISISATTPIGWAAGSTNLDEFTSYSNYGTSVIDFAAPGGDLLYDVWSLCQVGLAVHYCPVFDLVFSTGSHPDPGWASWYWSGGTSMAAPHATGVAALIIGKNGGDMKPAQVEAALRKSADDLGKPGKDDYYGHGRVNALRAVAN